MPAIDFAFDHSYQAGPEVHMPFVPVRLFSVDGLATHAYGHLRLLIDTLNEV